MSGEGNVIVWYRRHVLGWRIDVLAAALLGIAVVVWGAWLTREVLAFERQRIVSVSLQSLVESYVAETARAGVTDEEAERRTKAYLQAVEAAIAGLSDDQTIVLVSEATLGRSVPDVTPAVEAAVARAMTSGPAKGARDGR